MDIKFYRGDNHIVKFKFKAFTGKIDNIFLTVKCEQRTSRVQKKLDDGITLKEDGWYYVEFVPEDTDGLDCTLKMTYDIQIITDGLKYTVHKGLFILKEDITTPDCEV